MTKENPFNLYPPRVIPDWVERTLQQFCEAVRENPKLDATFTVQKHGRIGIDIQARSDKPQQSMYFETLYWTGTYLRVVGEDGVIKLSNADEFIAHLTDLFQQPSMMVALEELERIAQGA